MSTDADHPKAQWERGYIPTGVARHHFTSSGRLYTAWRNRATGEVQYLYGRQLRTASPKLVRRFKKV